MIQPAEIKENVIAQLQKDILALQGFRAPLETDLKLTGLGAITQAFPNQVFPVSAVHEFVSASAEEVAATSGFVSGLLGALMLKGACLWVSGKKSIFPQALKTFGVTADQVIFIQASNNKDALWIIEEGLKCESLASVVGEVQDFSFTDSRRLQLAVEKSHVTGFIHRSNKGITGNTACVSRWRVRPLPSSTPDALPGVGYPSWEVELSRVRNGKPGIWQVQWNDSGFEVIDRKVETRIEPIRKAV